MGAKHSYIHSFNPQVQDNAARIYTVNVTESQYGSWTKLSLVTDPTYSSTNSPVNSIEQVGAGAVTYQPSQGEEVSLTNCTQLLTQPPSKQQDSIIREVAEKLIDVETDLTAQDQSTSLAQPPGTERAEECHLQAQEDLDSLDLTPSEETLKKEAIAKSFLDHFESLVDGVCNTEDVASKLYGIAVLDDSEVGRASDGEEPQEERARELMQLLKRKLWCNPGWFVDICKILRACGVKAISEVIDDIQKKFPSVEMSILSSGSTSAAKASLPGRKTSCHNTFMKLEESFKMSGLQGATEFVHQLSLNQPDVVLIHEACLIGVDVSTLDLILNILSEKNLDINSKNECGQTPLHVACASLRSPADSDLVEVNLEQRLKIEHLLSHEASNWIKDKDGNTPLHLAILRLNTESVSTLLKSGKRCLNVANKKGNTALHLACKLGSVDIVKILCSYNANTSIQNKKMRTALHLACMHEHADVALELATHDPSTLDAFDKRRMTPLHICCKRGSEALACPLLKLKNCFPNKTDEENKTPLHYACTYDSLTLVATLLERDSSKGFVELQDGNGDTALHIASRLGFKQVVKELLNHKANKEIMNHEGKTPMDVAIESDHNSIAAKMLRKRGWNQRRKSLRQVRKLRRTLTQSTLGSNDYQSELSEILENSSDESSEDETVTLSFC